MDKKMKPEDMYLKRIRSKGRFPGFIHFGDGATKFDQEEREYKLELVDLYRQTIAERLKTLPPDEASRILLGKEISALFTAKLKKANNHSQNLVGYRYYEPLKFDGAAENLTWVNLVRNLVDDSQDLEKRVDTFVSGIHPLVDPKLLKNEVAFDAFSRSITSCLLMLADPAKHAVIATQPINRFLKASGEKALAGPLTGAEYLRVQQFLNEVKRKLDSLNLSPRDMIDVQSFIWVGDPKNYESGEDESIKPDEPEPISGEGPATRYSDSVIPVEGQPFNRIYYGPPGTGKTYRLQQQLLKDYTDPGPKAEKRYTWVTFHPSYGYEEFVEGLRPRLDEANDAGQVKYEIRAGAFKKLCARARKEPEKRFAMAIDEINRGNISKILGELITLIEIDKRERIAVDLAYSGEPFTVPKNVDLIGTMNTADRSLALVDTALRRRFEFEGIDPDTSGAEGAPLQGLTVTHGGQTIDIRRMLETINQRIEILYDREHVIGHSFFMPLKKVADQEKRFERLGAIFRQHIIPLLEEYFFEDWEKMRLVLGDNQKPRDDDRFIIRSGGGGSLVKLFGREHKLDELDEGEVKDRFEPNSKAFARQAAYIGIYDTAG